MVMRGARLWSVLVGKSCNDCTRQSEGKRCQGEGGQRAVSLSEEGRAVEKWRRWNSSKALWHRHRSALCGASATTSAFSQIHRDPHTQLGRSISQKSRAAARSQICPWLPVCLPQKDTGDRERCSHYSFSLSSAIPAITKLGFQPALLYLLLTAAAFLPVATADSVALALSKNTWALPSCSTCGGLKQLSNIVAQVTLSNLTAVSNGNPVSFRVDYLQHRKPSNVDCGTWLTNSMAWSSVLPTIVNNVLTWNVSNNTLGEADYLITAVPESLNASSVLRIKVAATNSAPSFFLSLPRSITMPDSSNPSNSSNSSNSSKSSSSLIVSGNTSNVTRSGCAAPCSVTVKEGSEPLVINFTSIQRGGWAGTRNLTINLSFTQSPRLLGTFGDLVAGIAFDDTCYMLGSACSARVSLRGGYHGSTRVSITATNSGGECTPFGVDNYTVTWNLTVEKLNAKPTFDLRTTMLSVDEDSTCIQAPSQGLRTNPCTKSSPLLHVYPNFLPISSISAGLYEDKTALGCPPNDLFTSYTGSCLDQKTSFSIELGLAQPASLFAEAPTMSANGTLQFRLAPDQAGQVSIDVSVEDDGVPPMRSRQVLTILVIGVNDPPTFNLLPEVRVLEDSTRWSGIVLDSMNAGCLGCSDEKQCAPTAVGDRQAASLNSPLCQTVEMEVTYRVPYPALFTPRGQPYLERTNTTHATLTFEPAINQFGEALIQVLIFDSGGRERGGFDTAAKKELTIRVIPINHAPDFELTTTLVTVEENSGELAPMQIATNITSGPDNEDCMGFSSEQRSVFCEVQLLTFVIEYIEGAELFSRPPAIDRSGLLTLRLYPGVTGAARVYARLEDNFPVIGPSKGNVSATKQFSVVVTPAEYQADFTLARKVTCLTLAQTASGQCACPRRMRGQNSIDVCSAAEPGQVPRVTVVESSGPVVVEAFATQITNAAGYQPGSLSVFTRNETTGLLDFQEQRGHEVVGVWGMEYATDFTVSNDSRHVYAVEAETDLVSAFDVTQTLGADRMDPRFRVADSYRKFILRSPKRTIAQYNDFSDFDRTPVHVTTEHLSTLALFIHDKQTIAIAAQGSDNVRNDVQRRKTAAAAPSKYLGLQQPANLWDKTVACWVFDLDSVLAPPGIPEATLRARFNVNPSHFEDNSVAISQFERVSDVRCGVDGNPSCSFSRSVNDIDTDWCLSQLGACGECNEKYPTSVRFASLRDLKGRLGPLLLTGPQCKVMSKCTVTADKQEQCRTRGKVDWRQSANDWDVDGDQVDLRTFSISNGDLDAIQFDDNLNSGMFLTFDMKQVEILMPVKQLTAEIWFTIDAPADTAFFIPGQPMDIANYPLRRALIGVEAYVQASDYFCSQGWSLAYTHNTSLTCFRFHLGLEGTQQGDKPLQSCVPRVAQGVWQHLVAIYDEKQQNMIMYLNGAQIGTQGACKAVTKPDPTSAENAACGNIVYPRAINDGPTGSKRICLLRPYNFSIGGWKNGEDEGKDFRDFVTSDYLSMAKHHGAIHMVRIYEVGLSAAEVLRQYDALKDKMNRNSLVNPVPSWAVLEYPQFFASSKLFNKNSPSIDFAHSSGPSLVVVHGSFDIFQKHRCEWHAEPPQGDDEAHVAYSPANTGDSSQEGYLGQTLSCHTPVWKYGARVTRFFISYLAEDECDAIGNCGGVWHRAWMKVCLEYDCGFAPGLQDRNISFFANSDDEGRYTLRSNANTVPKAFRFVQSSSLHLINMTAPHSLGSVDTLEFLGGFNLKDGMIRILPSNLSTGRLFNANFTVNSNGTGGDMKIVERGGGYPKDGGIATLCHSDSLEPMHNTVTKAYIIDGGNFYTTGSWEVVNNATATNNCTVTPKGSFKAAAMKTTAEGSVVEGGNLIEINIEYHGKECLSGIRSTDVALYYPGFDRKKQENSITKVVGLGEGEVSKAELAMRGSEVPILPDSIPKEVSSIDAIAQCGGNCTGTGFLGTCQIEWNSQQSTWYVTGITIRNHGTGYTSRFPPNILCRYCPNPTVPEKYPPCTLMQASRVQLFVMIPRRATFRFEIARGGSVRYSTTMRHVLMLSEPGLENGQWSGMWDKRYGVWTNVTGKPQTGWGTGNQLPSSSMAFMAAQKSESHRPLLFAGTSFFPVQLDDLKPATTFVLASNYWDGLTGSRRISTSEGLQLTQHEMSYLFQWVGKTGSLSCVQAINTSGAVSFNYFKFWNGHYIVAVNYREVFADGSTSTVARSWVYRMASNNPAGNAPSAPGLGGQIDPQKCSFNSSLGRSPIWTSDGSPFKTAGAVAVDTFIMNHSIRYGQVMYMAVANYYNSDTGVSSGISKLYMIGRPQDENRSLFGARAMHTWSRCSDSQKLCNWKDEDCHVHRCNQGCTARGRQGQTRTITCTCSNRAQTCSLDSECNSGITCTPQDAPVPLEDHTHCIQDEALKLESIRSNARVVLCEVQSFDVDAARSVAHLQSGGVHVVVFASDSARSKVFVTNDGADLFVEVQALPTRRATQLQFIQPKVVDRPFLLLSQDKSVVLYRWNGTRLVPEQSIGEVSGGDVVTTAFVDGMDFGLDYSYAVLGGGDDRLHNTINVVRGYAPKFLPPLDAPGAIESSPDGRHIYVVSQRTRSIFQFLRDAPSGEFEFESVISFPCITSAISSWETPPEKTPWGSFVTTRNDSNGPLPPSNVYLREGAKLGGYGYPVRSSVMSMLLMAPDGRFLYDASFFDNTVHIWSRDTSTGKLSYRSAFTDPAGLTGSKAGQYFMRGPRHMTFGQQVKSSSDPSDASSYMLLACSTSKSVVLLLRNVDTGILTFVDAYRDGERDISTFNVSAPARSPQAPPFPTRIGGASGAGAAAQGTSELREEDWARMAQVVRPFVLKGRQMLAIASSDDRPKSVGAAVIMEWKPSSGGYGTFEQVQKLELETSPVDIAYFEIQVAASKENEIPTEASKNEFLVIANSYGATTVYLWEDTGFVLHHVLPMPSLAYDDKGCSCLCKSADELAIPAVDQTDAICGPCFNDSVIRQSPDTCSPSRPTYTRDCQVTPLNVLPRAIKHFYVNASRQHFLAVAYWSAKDSPCLRVYSHVYRWNEDTPRRLDVGRVVWGTGFEPFFPVATAGAIGVEHVSVQHATHGTTDLVGFVEFVGASKKVAGVRMFRYLRNAYNPFLKISAGSFVEYEVLPVGSAFSLYAFGIDSEGTFLAVAARQNASSQGDAQRDDLLSKYDVPSALLKWNGTSFQVYQTLGTGFSSVAAMPGAFDANNLILPNCTASPKARGCIVAYKWPQADGLRGATSMYSFKDVDGELYLAVAQSLCDPGVGKSLCNTTAHPMSAILQWDRVNKRFGETLAYTDESHRRRFNGLPVRDEDLLFHRAALRIPVGRARQWTSITVGGGARGKGWPGVVEGGAVGGRMTLLISASLDEGVLVYEFRFKEVVGLSGAAAVALSPAEDFVYVASEDDKALAVLALAQRYDIIQRSGSQFRQVQVLSEEAIEGGYGMRSPIAHGLRGIRGMTHSQTTDCRGYRAAASTSGSAKVYLAGDACSTILVRGSMPRTQLPCGTSPPRQQCPPETPHLCTPQIDPLEPPAACWDVSFRTELVATKDSNPHIFTDDGFPRVIDKPPLLGALAFTPRVGAAGKARFRVAMLKASSSFSPSPSPKSEAVEREFEIEVLGVNQEPVIGNLIDEIVSFSDYGPEVKVFASNIVAEGAGIGNFTWEWDVYNITHPPPINTRPARNVIDGSEFYTAICARQNATLRQEVLAQNATCDVLNQTEKMQALFKAPPTFSFRRNQDGGLEGIVLFEAAAGKYGELRFYVRMNDGAVIDPLVGGSATSKQLTFLITILPQNTAPTFSVLKPAIDLTEDQGTVVLSGFATHIKTGLHDVEAGQSVSFSLWHVEPIRVFGWNVSTNLFETFSFNVDVNRSEIENFTKTLDSATLTFRMVPDFAGDVRVLIKLEDDGVGTFGGSRASLVAVNISVAPVNDAPTIKDNGRDYYSCRWYNTTSITDLGNSILFPVVTENYACNFTNGFCGYQKASELNRSTYTEALAGEAIPWVRADKRFVEGKTMPDTYYGAGPQSGVEAQGCKPGWVENEPFPYVPTTNTEQFCQKMDYFAVANGFCPSATTKQGEMNCDHESSCYPPDAPLCKDEAAKLKAGDYGFIQSKPLRGVVDHIVYPYVSGGSEVIIRTDVLTNLTYSFYYNMFDGVPSFSASPSLPSPPPPPSGLVQPQTVKSKDMGSLSLQARAPGANDQGNWTTVWRRVGQQTKYFEWKQVNVTFNNEFHKSSGLQVRFVVQKNNIENPYTVIAVDSITTPGGAVFRNDRKWKCVMELPITGVLINSTRTIENAFRVVQPPDELVTQIPTFTLKVISCTRDAFAAVLETFPCDELFFGKPSATSVGTLVLPLTRGGRGQAVISVLIEDDGLLGGALSHKNVSEAMLLVLTIDGYERIPPFALQRGISVLDGSGLEIHPRFAVFEALDGLPSIAKNHVQYVVKCTSTQPGMWALYPSIDNLGTLTLEIKPGFTGQGHCSVQLDFDVQGFSARQAARSLLSSEISAPQFFSIKVWPRPEVTSIQPALAHAFTSAVVTISGQHFGSVLSRHDAESYLVTAFVVTPYSYYVKGVKYGSERWEPCVGGTKYINDETLLCTIPPGAGMRDVKVEVIERGVSNRTGTLLRAFVGVELWLGGTAEDRHCQACGAPHRQEAVTECGYRGFIGSGVGPVHLPPKVDMERLNISSSVRALVVAKGRVFMGGSFATVNSTRVNGIVAYDRQTLRQVGMGLDGSVSAMALVDRERRLVVVAGSFTRLHQTSGSIISGGIALWDDTSAQWGAIGAATLNGVGLAVQVQGRRIFVGGRFTAVGDVQAGNVAVFVSGPHVMSRGILLGPSGATQPNCIAAAGGGRWEPLGEGIQGIVYALAAGGADGVVYAGGRLHLAGGVQVDNVAKFESDATTPGGGLWTGLVDSDCLRFKSGVCGVDGDVSSIAYVGEYLYVAGQFSSAGGKPAANVARFFSGRWENVGKGVDGPVHVIAAVRVHDSLAGACLYFAGDFKKVEDGGGVTDVEGLARWCFGEQINYPRGVIYNTSREGVTNEYWEKVELPPDVVSVRALAPHD